jgi:Isochorismatase family
MHSASTLPNLHYSSVSPDHRSRGRNRTDFESTVDFQRDFIEEGGFGHLQGGDLSTVQAAVPIAVKVLRLARKAGLTVVHTREGHEPGLKDCPTPKVRLGFLG